MKNDEYNIFLNKFKYVNLKKVNVNQIENNNIKIFNALFGINYSLKNNRFKNFK